MGSSLGRGSLPATIAAILLFLLGLFLLGLLSACSSRSERAREELLRRGIEVHVLAFFDLLDVGDEEGVALILEAGLNPPRRALRRASKDGHCNVVRLLLDRGYDAGTILGAEALIWATLRKHQACVEMLREAGATAGSRNRFGENMLTRTAGGKDKDVRLLRTLLKAGVDPEESNRNGETALIVAVKNRRSKHLRLLLSAGADSNARAPDGWTGLMYAVRTNQPEIVGELIGAGASVDAMSASGWTPLMMAAQEGRQDALELLLAAGADPNLGSQAGLNPLIRAVQSSRASSVEALLEAGADPSRPIDGVDALWWARRRGEGATREILESFARRRAMPGTGNGR